MFSAKDLGIKTLAVCPGRSVRAKCRGGVENGHPSRPSGRAGCVNSGHSWGRSSEQCEGRQGPMAFWAACLPLRPSLFFVLGLALSFAQLEVEATLPARIRP